MQAPEQQWWYAYGPFSPGENNLPHLGQVIRYYRELRGWKAQDLAEALGQSVRHVYEMESSATMPELISRRQALAKILSIPPVLFGLAIIVPGNQNDSSAEATTGIISVLNSHTMGMYETNLALSWELYYTASAQRAAGNIDHWIQWLRRAAREARGVKQDQLLAMLCRFYQLSGVAARDRMDLARALRDGKQAIDLALQLGNAELIAAALFRRAKTYLKQQKYEAALHDLEAALSYAERSRDPLKGYVYQATAEAYALVAPGDEQIQKKSLLLLDHVGRIVRKGSLENDGSFVRLNVAGLYMDRASILMRFQKREEARNALNIAHDHLGPELTRWQARLLIAEAASYLAEGDPEGCCEMAFEALKVVRATESRSNQQRIQGLYQQLHEQYPRYPLVSRLGTQLAAS
jgi:transcriptional regulator with XRE-family HTH domain